MRYHIRRSLGLPSGGDRSIFDNSAFASQNRGRIIAFIFILSSVTTLVSFLTFHNGSSSGSSHTGILTLDKAAKMFAINRGRGAHSSEIMKKRQMYDYLKQRHNDEIKSLKWLLVRGSRGRSNNMTTRIEDSFEENVSGVENNITVTSGDFGVAVSPLLINFLRTVPSNYTQRLPSGVFVEYYPDGGNTSLSLTLPLEQSQAWRGVVLNAGKDEAGKVRSQRRFTTFVGADLKLCLPEDYRLKSKNDSGHLKNTLPHPHPLPAPPVVVVEPDPREDEHKLDSRQPKRNIIDEPSSPKGFSESVKFSKTKHLVDRKLRCLSLFSLTQLFKCYTIDFFAIHTSVSRYGRDLEKILKTLLGLRPLIEIKVRK
ncbi:unnamed protein product [Orchesella dallaii]|uniref:Uncharacterized protein n=1 Tax=Orchesella dallaii TaxID=48710 RepID=A0ABP1S6E6_9HEXA